ncbi:MAG: DUF167 domain-containing protein [Desulfobacterales bacterium]|nr:DUF167 domain-containing protein [Desulfobacterales bacterium]
MLSIQEKPEGISIKVFVQPKSSQNKIVGIHGDALKVKLTAPPVEGAANNMCVKFLAKIFNIPKSSVEIVSGRTGRTKQILFRCEGSDFKRIKSFLTAYK